MGQRWWCSISGLEPPETTQSPIPSLWILPSSWKQAPRVTCWEWEDPLIPDDNQVATHPLTKAICDDQLNLTWHSLKPPGKRISMRHCPYWVSLWGMFVVECLKSIDVGRLTTMGSIIPLAGAAELYKNGEIELSKWASMNSFLSVLDCSCDCDQPSQAPATVSSLLWWTVILNCELKSFLP